MPSIFSRSRTASTPYPSSPDSPLGPGPDEFGRVSSRSSNKGASIGFLSSPGTKKERKKNSKEQAVTMARLRTISAVSTPTRGDSIYALNPVGPAEAESGEIVFQYGGIYVQEGAFLPTVLEKPVVDGVVAPDLNRSLNSSVSSATSSLSVTTSSISTMDYGYLSYQRHVVLSVEHVSRLVDVVCEELGTRGGITTPFIFSTLALDINANRIRRLIDTFLATCTTSRSDEAERKWREEAKYAGMHELGMALRWGLGRIVRVSAGQEMRGILPLELYARWRDEEESLLYPPTHFTGLLPSLPSAVRNILLTVLSLLARLTANSATSGHTPPTLSPLFGPLIFGLGPPSLPFHQTYVYYLHSVNALEHILLAFIRWQDNPRASNNSSENNMLGSVATLGVPKKLKEWIKGYPQMLPHLQSGSSFRTNAGVQQQKKPNPRKGARTVRVMSVRRNVRNYEKDLVRNAAGWAKKSYPTGAQNTGSAVNLALSSQLAESREWDRISPRARHGNERQPPKYSEAYKKRMHFSANVNPDMGNASPSSSISSGTNSPTGEFVYGLATLSSTKDRPTKDFLGVGLGLNEGEDRFKSLTDLRWGEFESLGFGGLGTGGEHDKKLEFDLTEGARTERTKKRQTLGWDDFSTAGFSRTDAPLSATLQFSAPLTATIERWPQEKAEIGKKLKKREKTLPPFGWDTSPVVGPEEVIEEAFVDVFCDLIWGSGWGEGLAGMSGAREQQGKVTVEDRECCWALVEFKSLPQGRAQAPPKPSDDPRTGSTLILFEEFVPLEYREQLALLSTGSRKRLPLLFSPNKKQWKPAPTLNGRPYVVGHVPRSPNYDEAEFDAMLQSEPRTKQLSLSQSVKVPITEGRQERPQDRPPLPSMQPNLPAIPPPAPSSEGGHSDSTVQSTTKEKRLSMSNKFKLPVSPSAGRTRGMAPAEYSSLDFETRLRGNSDDSNAGSLNGDDEDIQRRRRKDEDAWVDILVGSQERRMAGQDAVLRSRDPDAASLEVQKALSALQNTHFSDEDEPEPKGYRDTNKRVLHDSRPYGDDDDEDLDEIETVPRRERPGDVRDSYASTLDYTEDGNDGDRTSQAYGYTDGANEAEEDEPSSSPANKRLGYFDLHPERRPPSMIDDDPRARAMQKYEDSDEEEETLPAAPSPPPATTPPGGVRPLPVIPPPKGAAMPIPPGSEVPRPIEKNVSPSVLSPVAKPLPSKTAALIEMYREKEKGAPAPGAGAGGASKVPRGGNTGPRPDLPVPPANVAPQQPANPSPPELTEPKIPFDETGRASPGRYVHGAPLHNVLEEEEEED